MRDALMSERNEMPRGQIATSFKIGADHAHVRVLTVILKSDDGQTTTNRGRKFGEHAWVATADDHAIRSARVEMRQDLHRRLARRNRRD